MTIRMALAGAALSFAAALAAPQAAAALTYTSLLEYSSTEYGPSGPFGTVTIHELDANNVRVTVDLADDVQWFVDTDRSHDAFSFNIKDSPESTVSIVEPAGGGEFEYRNRNPSDSTYRDNDPFGDYANAFALDHSDDKESGPLVFNVYNANGITFAGVGATFDEDGRLVSTGTGNRFFSNTNGWSSGHWGGWWFAAQVESAPQTAFSIYGGGFGDGGCDCGDGFFFGGRGGGGCDQQPKPFTIAARDAFVTGGVPEPSTWALVILGFGGAGATLRRRRVAPA